MADKIQLREWGKLTYYDPAESLRELRRIQIQFASSNLEPNLANLRTNAQRKAREFRQAALFSFGMSCRVGRQVLFSMIEKDDYDFVALCQDGVDPHFFPVQLKELPPEEMNPAASIDLLLAKASVTYPRSSDVTLALYLNRNRHLDIPSIRIPPLNLGGLFLFGSMSDDQSEWILIGDLLGKRIDVKFRYPLPHPLPQ